MKEKFIKLFTLSLILNFCGLSFASSDKVAFLDPSAIEKAWAASYGSIDAMKISYSDRVITEKSKDPGDDRVLYAHLEKIERNDFHHSRESYSADGFDDAGSVKESSFNGKVAKQFRWSEKTVIIQSGLSGAVAESLNMFKSIMLMEGEYLKTEEHPEGIPAFVYLLKGPNVKVRPKLEYVNGELCHVIESPAFNRKEGTDAIMWVAHDKDMLLMKYERYDNGEIIHEVLNDEITKSENGLWYPKKINRKTDGVYNEMEVKDFVPNIEVEMEAFDVRPPDGTRVFDRVLGLQYVVGVDSITGGPDLVYSFGEVKKKIKNNKGRDNTANHVVVPSKDNNQQELPKIDNEQSSSPDNEKNASEDAEESGLMIYLIIGLVLVFIVFVIIAKRIKEINVNQKIKNFLFGILLFLSFSYMSYHCFAVEISLKQLTPDNSCGPQCLRGLMNITGEGEPLYKTDDIYRLMGKPNRTPTSFADLKIAAEKLGFSAKGYKYTVDDLKKMKGYAILPVSTGDEDGLFHFILVAELRGKSVVVIDTYRLGAVELPLSELKEAWNGYALVISAGTGMAPLKKEYVMLFSDAKAKDELELAEKAPNMKIEELKNFGNVDAGSIKKHTFVVSEKNRRIDDIELAVKSCSCTKPKFGKDENGRHTIAIEQHVDEPGVQTEFLVIRTKPEGELLKYAVQAYGKNSHEIMPKIGYFSLPEGGRAECPVKIDFYTDADGKVEYEDVECDRPDIKIGSFKKTLVKDGDVKIFRFEINTTFKSGDDDTVRKLDGKMKFKFNTNNGERIIPMEYIAMIGTEKIKLSPKSVFMIIPEASEKDIQKDVDVKLDKTLLSDTFSIDHSNLPFDVKVKNVSGEKTISIIVSKENISNIPKGLNKYEIKVSSGNDGDHTTALLPVNIFIK
ncbi:MAG: hypothetical protein JEZ07_19425 [Phycisphaerae bacterium]|nr:hypothetical protein [Phycisphaerae bacterium]